MNQNLVSVEINDFNIIKLTKETLGVPEEKAAKFILEVGMFNILHYPVGNAHVDKLLSEGKYNQLVNKIKDIYGS